MISQPLTIIRTNKLGKPYVQNADPSTNNHLSVNDMWLNPSEGTFKTWNGEEWEEMQWGSSAIMDDCITNRMIANDISANKITTGILQSQDGTFILDLTTGEAKLLNLRMGGNVEGNIIATSTNGLTRVRLRGTDNDIDVTAGIIFEQRENVTDDEWINAGQIFFGGIADGATYATLDAYAIGNYDSRKPVMGYYQGNDDGYLWRAVSTDYTKASMHTYHGTRLVSRSNDYDDFQNVTPVLTAIGNCMTGTTIAVNGVVTCTYKYNDVMQLDFNLKVTVGGTGSSAFGISPSLLRSLNAEIPSITPTNGGSLQIYSATGGLVTTNVGASFLASDGLWTPSRVVTDTMTAFSESGIGLGVTLIGTCYGVYNLEDE